MALMGQLGEFQLHHIIALLEVEKQTGELLVEDGAGQRIALYLQGGQIIHATSTGGAEGFEVALEPFAWRRGKFHFEAYQPEIEPTIAEGNATLVQAGRRRAAEAAEVLARVPSVHLILKLLPQARPNSGFINLAPDEWRFLTLVDGRRDLAAIAGVLGYDHYAVRVMASRLLATGLVEAVDPRRTMVRMVVQPLGTQERRPLDARVALMDDLALDLLQQGQRHTRRLRIQVLTAGDQSEVLYVEGRPDLTDWLLVSERMMAQLQVNRNDYVYVKLIEE